MSKSVMVDQVTYRSRALSKSSLALLCLGVSMLTVLCCALATAHSLVFGGALLLVMVTAIWFPFVVESPEITRNTLLLLLAATITLSIKKHLWPDAGHLGGAIGIKFAITDLLVLALVSTLLLMRGQSTRVRISVPKGATIAFAVYLLFASLSTFAGGSPRLGLFQLSAYIQAFLLFVFLLNYLSTPHRLRVFVAGLLAGLVMQSGITILQAQYPGKFRYAFLGAQEEAEHRVVRGSISLPDVDLGTTSVGGSIQERPTGLLIHPNVLALYLVLTIPLAVGVCLLSQGWWRGLSNVAILGCAAAAMYYTLSRSGWLALALALGILGLIWLRVRPLRLPPWLRGVVVTVVLAGILAVGWNSRRIYQRMTETADDAVYFRKNLNIAALKMAASHPFFGVGLNTFVDVVREYDASKMSDVKQYPAHNIALLELAETGLFGGLAFLAIWFCMFREMFSLIRAPGGPESKVLVISCLAGLVGFFIGDMSNFAYRIPVVTSIVWAQAAVGMAAGRLSPDQRQGALHV